MAAWTAVSSAVAVLLICHHATATPSNSRLPGNDTELRDPLPREASRRDLWRCPPLCRMRCPWGNVKDERNCPICKCLPPPADACFDVICARHCPGGYTKDKRGCKTCNCRPVICPAIACDPNSCPNGFEYEANGCNLCRCKKPATECPIIRCPLDFRCPFGYERGPDGCQRSCRCQVRPCPSFAKCQKPCLFGYITDPSGCETCACRPPPLCPKRHCPLDLCPWGFQTDNNGCQTCRCKPGRVCPLQKCPDLRCLQGVEKDVNGCPTCRCRPCRGFQCQLYCRMPEAFSQRIARCGCDCTQWSWSYRAMKRV